MPPGRMSHGDFPSLLFGMRRTVVNSRQGIFENRESLFEGHLVFLEIVKGLRSVPREPVKHRIPRLERPASSPSPPRAPQRSVHVRRPPGAASPPGQGHLPPLVRAHPRGAPLPAVPAVAEPLRLGGDEGVVRVELTHPALRRRRPRLMENIRLHGVLFAIASASHAPPARPAPPGRQAPPARQAVDGKHRDRWSLTAQTDPAPRCIRRIGWKTSGSDEKQLAGIHPARRFAGWPMENIGLAFEDIGTAPASMATPLTGPWPNTDTRPIPPHRVAGRPRCSDSQVCTIYALQHESSSRFFARDMMSCHEVPGCSLVFSADVPVVRSTGHRP